ncbi:MAG TPA: tRNA pseudouridine(55) synthase TruB [Cytophagaceae bacterium]|jgi:tRNA pseudouridine55 synthase|nr:tRNA pseudouridine(55) synthase TruB [Cytophagaceae bacterium]
MELPEDQGTILLIDKPLTWTSFDVVRKIRNLTKIKKTGHAGTLDPLATGLLIVCQGKATKKIEAIQNAEKEYTGTIHLGSTTASYDLESEPTPQQDVSHLTFELIQAHASKFIGFIDQVPPIFSAIKVDGKRSYDLARQGLEPELKSRRIEIKAFDITHFDLPVITFRVACSKGTYIRSLAHDLGQSIGVGAYLKSLRRTKIGNYSVDHALTPDQFKDTLSSSSL